jgi:glutamine cyclotransferase
MRSFFFYYWYSVKKIACWLKPWAGAGLAFGMLAAQAVPAAPLLSWQLVRQLPHDPHAYTEGLLNTPCGLYESTGLYGASSLRLVEPQTGKVLQYRALDKSLFGEGLALANDRLIQLTWKEGRALVYTQDTLQPIEQWTYRGEGWGLAFDGAALVMSDGSAWLTRRDPGTFAILGRVQVHDGGRAVAQLNELEYHDKMLWANIYMSDRIARIEPSSGVITGFLDLQPLRQRLPPATDTAPPPEVLNGIAATPEGNLLVTGKFWPAVFEIRLDPDAQDGL